MSNKDNAEQDDSESSLLDQTLSAFRQQLSENSTPKDLNEELKQQFQFPDGVWEKLAKR